MTQLLDVHDLRVNYRIKSANAMPWTPAKNLAALAGVDFQLEKGETLGIVGESGCGKSTLARALLQLVPATGTAVWKSQHDLIAMDKAELMQYRSQIQLVFQDPLAALNPRMTVGQIIAEPLHTHQPSLTRPELKQKVKAIMDKVGLLPDQINRYPHEFSGGQCQRIGIARALIIEPELLICDEPVSALDVSIQAQVINLLMDLQQELELTLIFIAHDLSVVRHISNRVMVLYLGRVMEIAERDDLYEKPAHPYTQSLIASVPVPDPDVPAPRPELLLDSELPSPMAPPSGCVFRTRCRCAQAICAEQVPELKALATAHSHRIACHFPLDQVS